LERGPHGSNSDSTSRRFLNWNAEELEIGDKGNGRSTEKDEEAS